MAKTFRERAEELVAQMTLEEKVSQTLHGAAEIERLGIPKYNWWNEALHGIARTGTATLFPQAIGLAASFDEELVAWFIRRWLISLPLKDVQNIICM